jgi:hypothetical protein
MFPSFLPPAVGQLTQTTSIALAQNIQRQAISTILANEPIYTTYVQQGQGGTPILLIHGFDSSVLEYRRLLPLLAAKNAVWWWICWDLALQIDYRGLLIVLKQLKPISTLFGKL